MGGEKEHMSEKRVISRNVAIALGTICVILSVSLFGAISQITSLHNQVTELTAIVKLTKLEIWVDHQTVSQPAGSYTSWTFRASYAGYIVVGVESSTTSNTYIQVSYHSYTVDYYNKLQADTKRYAAFSVLPGTIEIRVGNTNLSTGATETVSIAYWY